MESAHQAADMSALNSGTAAVNLNTSSSAQSNYTINGGPHNQMFNGPTIYYEATHEPLPPALFLIPFTRDIGFIERPEIVGVSEKLSRDGRWVAVAGIGGVGKSQLAIEYCYRRKTESSEDSVIWLHASSAARFEQDVRATLAIANVPGHKEKDADIYVLFQSWLLNSRRKWLLVLDNLDDADFLYHEEGSPAAAASTRLKIDCLPKCTHGKVLITSRRRDVALRLVNDVVNLIQLQPDSKLAIDLLKSKLDHKTEDAIIGRMAEKLENMPLAIAQAVAYIQKRAPRASPESYLAMLEAGDKKMLALLQGETKELRRDAREARNSILLTWQISFDHLYTTRRSAAHLLLLMSFYDHQGIPETLLQSPKTTDTKGRQQNEEADDDSAYDSESSTEAVDDAFESDLESLQDYAFISALPDKVSFAMHRLVQLAAQVWTKSIMAEEYLKVEKQSLAHLYAAFPSPEQENMDRCRLMYPHVKLVLEMKVQDRDKLLLLAAILHNGSWFAHLSGSYTEAMIMSKKAVRIQKQVLGSDHPTTMAGLCNLIAVLHDLGKYEEAEAMQQETLEASQKVLGRHDPVTLSIMENFACTMTAQGKRPVAETMFRQTLEQRKMMFGEDHPETLASMNNVGMILTEQAKYEDAEEIFNLVHQKRQKMFGSDHRDTLVSKYNLAFALHRQRKYEAAERLHREVLEARERVLGKNHPDTLSSMSSIGSLLHHQKNDKAAKAMHECVLEKRIVVLGEHHRDTLCSVKDLAHVLWFSGDHQAAISVIHRCEQSSGVEPDDNDLGAIANALELLQHKLDGESDTAWRCSH